MPTSNGSGQIVAIVDAYDNPNVGSDLATYRSEFGLGSANFTKYNQEGQQSNYPAGSADWGIEIDLDVDMVSAACPKCTIILVEANSSNFSDLGTAEVEAVKLGAHIVSNSYSGTGCTGTCGYGTDYDTKGVEYLASAGDDGFGIGAPAQVDTVVSVGGTSLTKDTGTKRGWTETAWSGTGAGCSSVTKPSWQHDPGCTFRTANDVAADANPDTGVAEYDSYDYRGWFVVGGTSVSSPLLGGAYGLAGNAKSEIGGKAFWTLSSRKRKRDLCKITSGSDGSCSPTYLCTAQPISAPKERASTRPTAARTAGERPTASARSRTLEVNAKRRRARERPSPLIIALHLRAVPAQVQRRDCLHRWVNPMPIAFRNGWLWNGFKISP